MKKLLSLLVLVAISAIALTSCSKNDGVSDAPVDTPDAFVVGFDASFPPYGFTDAVTNEFKGFDLDLAKEVARRNGWKIILKAIDWDAKDSELNSGNINCIWNGFTITEERKDKYTWSSPYVKNEILILVNAQSSIKTLADLNGKRVVSQEGSSGADAIESFLKEQQAKNASFAFKEYKKVPDYNSAFTMLDTDAVDAIALDAAVAQGFIIKGKGKFATLAEHVSMEEYGIGFKLGNTELRDKVENTLKEMVADGTVKGILNHWANEEDPKHGGKSIDFILK